MQFFPLNLLVCLLFLPSLTLFSQNIQLRVDSIFATVSQEKNDSVRVRKLLLTWQEVRDNDPMLARNLLEKIENEAQKTNQEKFFISFLSSFASTQSVIIRLKLSIADKSFHF